MKGHGDLLILSSALCLKVLSAPEKTGGGAGAGGASGSWLGALLAAARARSKVCLPLLPFPARSLFVPAQQSH